MILLSFIVALAGFALMGLSQPQHHGWALRRPVGAAEARLLRHGGLALIALSLPPALAGWGLAFGAVGWWGLLSLAAALLLLLRTYLPPPSRR